MANRIYVGKIRGSDVSEVFRSTSQPTEESHEQYGYVTGPFRTARGAKYCANYYGACYVTVSEFEKAAVIRDTQSELISGYVKFLNRTLANKT